MTELLIYTLQLGIDGYTESITISGIFNDISEEEINSVFAEVIQKPKFRVQFLPTEEVLNKDSSAPPLSTPTREKSSPPPPITATQEQNFYTVIDQVRIQTELKAYPIFYDTKDTLFKRMLKLLEIDENLRAKTRSPTEMYSINETVAALLNLEISAFCGLFGVQLSTDKNVEQLKTEANMYIWAQALLDSCCHDFEQVDVVQK